MSGLDNYETLATIGEGTYGIVLRARSKETGQLVAVKKFKEADTGDDQVRKTALREIRILKQVRHDNIVNLIEVFRRKGKLYLVFEHVDHTILEDLERNMDGMDDLEVKKCIYQLLLSIDFCHSHQIIHRDIKPENLLVSKSGALKLCDFGFARVLGSPGSKYTDYVATRWYRSPELLVGDREYGKEVDIWAIGCMFAELKCGSPLFPGDSDFDQLQHIIRCLGPLIPRHTEIFKNNPLFQGMAVPTVSPEEVVGLRQRFPQFSDEALSFLSDCLIYEPTERATCAQLLEHPYLDGFSEFFEAEIRPEIEKENMSNSSIRRRKRRADGDTKDESRRHRGKGRAPSRGDDGVSDDRMLAFPQLTSEQDDQSAAEGGHRRKKEPGFPHIPNNSTRSPPPTQGSMHSRSDASGFPTLEGYHDGYAVDNAMPSRERKKKKDRSNDGAGFKAVKTKKHRDKDRPPASPPYRVKTPQAGTNMDNYIMLPKSPNVGEMRGGMMGAHAQQNYGGGFSKKSKGGL